MIRAKFRCSSVVPGFSDGQKKISMHAVYGSDGENADYSKYTPSGNLDILIDGSTKAVDYFIQGNDYYLDFTAVEKVQ